MSTTRKVQRRQHQLQSATGITAIFAELTRVHPRAETDLPHESVLDQARRLRRERNAAKRARRGRR